MSLILDALRKLEREKDARAPGILVVGSVPWGETSRARRFVLAGVAVAALALAVAVGWLLRPAPAPPAAPRRHRPRPRPHAPPGPRPTPAPPGGHTATLVGAAGRPALGSADPARPAGRPQGAPARRNAAPAAECRRRRRRRRARIAGRSRSRSGSPLPRRPRLTGLPPLPRPDGLRLTAISQRDGRPVALINDRLVFEGDSFDGVRVIRIGEAEVEVEVRGERRVLRF